MKLPPLQRIFRRSGVLICLLFFAVSTHAQDKLILLSDSTKSQWIGLSTCYFTDTSNKLEVTDITAPGFPASNFIASSSKALALGNRDVTIWTRFTVVNHSSKHWLLSELNYNVDSMTFFYRDSSGGFGHIHSGSYLPLSARRYESNIYAFDLPLKQDDTQTFYLRIKTFKAEFPLSISTYEQFVADRFENNLIKGMYYGFVLLLIIYSLTLFFVFKEKSYLYYVFYLFFTALLMAEHAGVNALVYGNRLHFLWPYGPAITAMIHIAFWTFSNHFLDLRKNLRWAHYFAVYVAIPFSIFVIILNFFNLKLYASVLNQLFALGTLFLATTVGIILYRKGIRIARYYILANSFYFVGVIIFILKTMAVLPYNNFTTNALEIGSAVEMMMFSISLAERINILRRERAAAEQAAFQAVQEQERRVLEETARMLESKVKERTTELNSSLHQLQESQKLLEEKNNIISQERDRSDELLLNILPYETAQELKEKGKAVARPFESVSIMFTDFKDFTSISEGLSPEQLVAELDYCFRNFDEIAERCNIEKIKTIGDSYMAAGGLPVANESHAQDVVQAAVEIQRFMVHYNRRRSEKGLAPFEIRIGVNSGPVVAGIVGTRKFAYDIWGDSVNLASRMESSSEPGRVNISGNTYQLVRDKFRCTYRGKIAAKNKGEVDMYFVEGEVNPDNY